MGKRLFTVLPVRPLVAEAWCAGLINDYAVMYETGCFGAGLGGGPVVLLVLRVDGNAAGMRRLFAWLRDVARTRPIAGFAMRTRLKAVARVFERFGGTVTFDEGDGDCRWFAPADPGVAWLRGRGPGGCTSFGQVCTSNG